MSAMWQKLKGKGLRASALTSSSDALIFVFQLGVSILTARALLPEGRGELTTILIWPVFIFSLLTGGLRFTVIYFVGNYPEKKASVIRMCFSFGFISASIAGVVNYFLATSILQKSSELTVSLTQFVGAFQPLLFFVTFQSILLQAQRKYSPWNFFRIMDPFLFLVTIALLMAVGSAGLVEIVVAFLVMKVPIGICMLPHTWGAGKGGRFDVSLTRSMLTYTMKCLPTGWMGQANAQLDQVILSAFFRPELLGIYRIAVSAAGVVRFVPMGFQRTILSETASAGDPVRKRRRMRESVLLGTVFTAIAVIPIYILIGPAIRICFGEEFSGSVVPARILVFAAGLKGICAIMSNGMRGIGRPLIPLVAEGSGAVITVVLLAVLLPSLNIYGAAVATLVAAAVTYAVLLRFIIRYTAEPC